MRQYRIRVFLSIYIGYAGYYIVRSNFSVASPYLKKNYGFTTADIGLITLCLAVSCGISKFVMGMLSDKSNPRFYIATGLLASAFLNLIFGATASKGVMMLLMVLLGIFQGMGAPAAHKSLSNWWAEKERGSFVSMWNTSHNLGSGTVAPIVGFALAAFGPHMWKSIFFVPSAISIIMAVLVVVLGADTPESVGLPPIQEFKAEEYKGEKIDKTKLQAHSDLSIAQIFIRYVASNPYIWVLALSNAFVYIVRYGVLNWIPIYLNEAKGFSLAQARSSFALFEYAAIPGTILIGWMSDRFFHGKRAGIAAALMALLGVIFLGYWASSSLWAIDVEIALMGIFVYGPQMLIAALTIDLAPRFAIGSTTGFVGLFGYIFGEATASYGIGALVGKNGWNMGFGIIAVSAVFGIICFLILTRAERYKKVEEPEVEGIGR
ncbi:MFS transporter [Bifidobacterium xylocopae]|uniref:Major facilitator superfamily (MFS) profile domain-containing protein n=1 Tax=Bifidobacterium xylocopae TaxID=2493119 RepID=A0A366KG33_9BIFI|nr:hypothetical protein CRD59_02670 [Bifidobacterium xylocopae]